MIKSDLRSSSSIRREGERRRRRMMSGLRGEGWKVVDGEDGGTGLCGLGLGRASWICSVVNGK